MSWKIWTWIHLVFMTFQSPHPSRKIPVLGKFSCSFLTLAPGTPNDRHSSFWDVPNVVRFLLWKIRLSLYDVSCRSRHTLNRGQKLRVDFTTLSPKIVGRKCNGGVLPQVGKIGWSFDSKDLLDVDTILCVFSFILSLQLIFLKLVCIPDPPLVLKFVLFHIKNYKLN